MLQQLKPLEKLRLFLHSQNVVRPMQGFQIHYKTLMNFWNRLTEYFDECQILDYGWYYPASSLRLIRLAGAGKYMEPNARCIPITQECAELLNPLLLTNQYISPHIYQTHSTVIESCIFPEFETHTFPWQEKYIAILDTKALPLTILSLVIPYSGRPGLSERQKLSIETLIDLTI